MSGIKLGAAFQFNVGCPILEGLVTVGKFDGKHPSLACATVGHRIIIHDSQPAEAGAPERDSVHSLNFNKETTALVSGSFGDGSDVLVMGSTSTISAYNVEKNSDVFYRELPDGVFSAAIGPFGPQSEPLLFVGGNCSTFGIDKEGQEKYWAVAGSHVTAMTLLPWKTNEPSNRLLTGSDDYDIRVFDGMESAVVTTEGDKVTRLVAAPKCVGRFAYALANGTLGVYEHQERAWRVKSKAYPTSMAFVDVDFDGVPELVCTWSDGTVEVRRDRLNGRKHEAGDVIFKENYGAPTSAVVVSDYRGDGRTLPMICTYDGEVRGLMALETTVEEAVENKEKTLLQSLLREKQQLQFDLKNLETQISQQKANASKDTSMDAPPPNSVMLSANTSVKLRLRPMSESKSIDLNITASDGAVIRGALVSGELIFPQSDCSFFYAENPTGNLSCPVSLEKDVGTELSISVLVGSPLSEVFQVHDLKFRLPRFCMHVPVQELPRSPTGFVTARISERVGRYHSWLASCFNASTQPDADFRASFVCLRDGSGLEVSASTANGGEFTVRCDNMSTCGDIIQDLGAFLGLSELESFADFPTEFEAFKDVLQRVEEFNSVRMKLTAEIADSTQLVKALVIKAEDARILNDMRLMKKMYGSLYEVNRELMGEFLKRSNNHNELLAALKEVNTMIHKAGQLRIGQAKSQLVQDCRGAIKANNIHTLFSIIKTGRSA